MPRRLTSDAHEWSNEIPTVPTYRPAKWQQRERTLALRMICLRGKKTLLSSALITNSDGALEV